MNRLYQIKAPAMTGIVSFRLMLLIAFSLLIADTSAQQFKGGAIGGLSTGQIDGDDDAGYNRVDFVLGAWVSTMPGDKWEYRAELSYVGKGSKIVINNASERRTVLRYVEFPFLFRYHFQHPFLKDFTLGLGPAPAFLFSSKIEINGTEAQNTKYSDFHTFDLAGMADIGYYITERLQVSLRWSYSALPFRNNPNWFNHVMSYTLSYQF